MTDNPNNLNSPNDNGYSPSSYTRQRLSFGRFVFYFITLAVLVLIYFKYTEIKTIGQLFSTSNYFWLSGIIVLQVFSYYFQALNYKYVLKVKDLEVKTKELYPMSFVVQFLNQALPSAGLSGQVFFIQYLKKYGLTVTQGLSRALLEVMTLYMAFGTFFVASSVLVFQGGFDKQVPEIRYIVFGFVLIALIAIGIFIFLQKKKRSSLAQWILKKIHKYFEKKKKKNGETTDHSQHIKVIFDQFSATFNMDNLKKKPKAFWLAYFWQNMILLSHVVTFYLIAFAIGHPISFALAFIVFTFVKFLSMIAFVPGGLGVFEGGMILLLVSFGVPAEPAFSMTLLIRAFTFWFPMPIGWILYKMYFHNQELENPYDDLVPPSQPD